MLNSNKNSVFYNVFRRNQVCNLKNPLQTLKITVTRIDLIKSFVTESDAIKSLKLGASDLFSVFEVFIHILIQIKNDYFYL